MEEVFLDIEGYEGLYQVSNLGNVKSLVNHKGVAREKLLKPSINSVGYLQVSLYKNKTNKSFKIHRLVAQSFLPNQHNFNCVNHKDECKINNVVTNLEWCTHKYNMNFGTIKDRIGKANSKSNKNNPKLSKAVGAFKNNELVMAFQSTMEAQRQGFNQGNVAACCRGERKSHKGYEWRYI